MSARVKLTHLAGKIALLLVVIFVMTVVLAAMPGHHGSSTQNPTAPAQNQIRGNSTDHKGLR